MFAMLTAPYCMNEIEGAVGGNYFVLHVVGLR